MFVQICIQKEIQMWVFHHIYPQKISILSLIFPKPVSHHHMTFPYILNIPDCQSRCRNLNKGGEFCLMMALHVFITPGSSNSKESTCSVGDLGSIPGLGGSPEGGHGNPHQYSCLENPHGRRSLVSYSPWARKESDMTESLSAHITTLGLPDGSVVKNMSVNAGDTGQVSLTPGLGRSPGGGKGKNLRYSSLENPMDREAWGHSPWGH